MHHYDTNNDEITEFQHIEDADDNTYYGTKVEGQYEGIGFKRYANGSFYYGSWKNGKREGEGISFDAAGKFYTWPWLLSFTMKKDQ